MFWLITIPMTLFLLVMAIRFLLDTSSDETSISLLGVDKKQLARQEALQLDLLHQAIRRLGYREIVSLTLGEEHVFKLTHNALPLQFTARAKHIKPLLMFEGVLPSDALLATCTISDGYHTQRTFELDGVSPSLLHATSLEELLFQRCDAYRVTGCHLSGRHFKWSIELTEYDKLEDLFQHATTLQTLLTLDEATWLDTLYGWCISLKRREDASRAATYLLSHDEERGQRLIDSQEALNMWARVTTLEAMHRRGVLIPQETYEELRQHVLSDALKDTGLRLLLLIFLLETKHPAGHVSRARLHAFLPELMESFEADAPALIAFIKLLSQLPDETHHRAQIDAWLQKVLKLPIERMEKALQQVLERDEAHTFDADFRIPFHTNQTLDEVLHALFREALHGARFHELEQRTRFIFSSRHTLRLSEFHMWAAIVRARAPWVSHEPKVLLHLVHIIGKLLPYHSPVSQLLFTHLLPTSPHIRATLDPLLTHHPPDTAQRWSLYGAPLVEGYLGLDDFSPLVTSLLIHCPDRDTAHRAMKKIDLEKPHLALFMLHWVHSSNIQRHEKLLALIEDDSGPLTQPEEHAALTLMATPGHLNASYELAMKLLAARGSSPALLTLKELQNARHLEAIKSTHEAMLQVFSRRQALYAGRLSIANDANHGGLTLSEQPLDTADT